MKREPFTMMNLINKFYRMLKSLCGLSEPVYPDNEFDSVYRKELRKLPDPTRVGKGILGCLVNGKAWAQLRTGGIMASLEPQLFSIWAGLFDRAAPQTISVFLVGPHISVGHYRLDDSERKYAELVNIDLENRNVYRTNGDALNSGVMTITQLDEVNRIISGTFSFTIWVNEHLKYKVTHGRFDVKYKTGINGNLGSPQNLLSRGLWRY